MFGSRGVLSGKDSQTAAAITPSRLLSIEQCIHFRYCQSRSTSQLFRFNQPLAWNGLNATIHYIIHCNPQTPGFCFPTYKILFDSSSPPLPVPRPPSQRAGRSSAAYLETVGLSTILSMRRTDGPPLWPRSSPGLGSSTGSILMAPLRTPPARGSTAAISCRESGSASEM